MPYPEGKTLKGWGVVRNENGPWHFVALFQSEEEARQAALAYGPDYIVRYGENREGSDDFMWDGKLDANRT